MYRKCSAHTHTDMQTHELVYIIILFQLNAYACKTLHIYTYMYVCMYMAKFYLNKINFIIFVAIAMAMAVKERKFISATQKQLQTHTQTHTSILILAYTLLLLYITILLRCNFLHLPLF